MRCAVATDDRLDALLIERVLSEYREMPGLALTLDQACRSVGVRRRHVRPGCRPARGTSSAAVVRRPSPDARRRRNVRRAPWKSGMTPAMRHDGRGG